MPRRTARRHSRIRPSQLPLATVPAPPPNIKPFRNLFFLLTGFGMVSGTPVRFWDGFVDPREVLGWFWGPP